MSFYRDDDEWYPDDDDSFDLDDLPTARVRADEVGEHGPVWTWRRVLLLILALLMIAALLAYSYSGLFQPPPPTLIPLTRPPLPMI
jgi:hypothetical protein